MAMLQFIFNLAVDNLKRNLSGSGLYVHLHVWESNDNISGRGVITKRNDDF